MALAICLMILIGILIPILWFTLEQKDDDTTNNDSSSSAPKETDSGPSSRLDPEWVQSMQARETTPFDPYNKETPDCSLGNYVQPHVHLQCKCQETITIVADDIRESYQELKVELLPLFGYDGPLPFPDITSCDPRNTALLWMASGTATRSASPLLDQRYLMAMLFDMWEGTGWGDNNGWYNDALEECQWLHVQCNENKEVISLAMDATNLYGTVRSMIFMMRHGAAKFLKLLVEILSHGLCSAMIWFCNRNSHPCNVHIDPHRNSVLDRPARTLHYTKSFGKHYTYGTHAVDQPRAFIVIRQSNDGTHTIRDGSPYQATGTTAQRK